MLKYAEIVLKYILELLNIVCNVILEFVDNNKCCKKIKKIKLSEIKNLEELEKLEI
ncbi:MAG: hypothetical protein MJH09_04605 [Cetobacterium sp.]|nr:hypothetical protein [Cetobacterium sp.]